MKTLIKVVPFIMLLDGAFILQLLLIETWVWLTPSEALEQSWERQTEPAHQTSESRRVTPPRRTERREPPRLSCARRNRRIPPAAGTLALVLGPQDHAGWADYYSAPGGQGERLGQALIGDNVRVLSLKGKWSEVELPGAPDEAVWLETSHLTAGSEQVRTSWKTADIQIVTEAPGIEVRDGPFLPFGARLPIGKPVEENGLSLLLPDGCEVIFAQVYRSSLSGPLALLDALEEAKYFRRVPYQTGANTRFAMDGPGLVFLVFRAAGQAVPRRLEALSVAGLEVSLEAAKPGDVLFFETYNSGRPQPVILLDAGETYIAASPSGGVGLGVVSRMHNRKVLSVRRYF